MASFVPLAIASAAAAALVLRSRRRRPRLELVDAAPREPTRVEQIETLLQRFVADEARPGHFYQVQLADSAGSIAKAALATIAVEGGNHVLEYIHCMTGGPGWNLRLYGTPSTSKRYPSKWLLPGLGQGLRAAFRPHNADALALALTGFNPKKTINSKTGEPVTNAGNYGLLWLPPVELVANDDRYELTCDPFQWDDGSSTIDPSPALMELLEAA